MTGHAIMMTHLALFVAAVLVGVLAQKWKGNIGVAWWFWTIAVEGFVYCLGIFAVMGRSHLLQDGITPAALAIFAIIFGAGTVALIVVTLPRKNVA